MQIELNQIRAMLYEICAASGKDNLVAGEITKIGTGKIDWDNLEGIRELTDIMLGARQALSSTESGEVTFDPSVWQVLESIYGSRVIKPLFAD